MKIFAILVGLSLGCAYAGSIPEKAPAKAARRRPFRFFKKLYEGEAGLAERISGVGIKDDRTRAERPSSAAVPAAPQESQQTKVVARR